MTGSLVLQPSAGGAWQRGAVLVGAPALEGFDLVDEAGPGAVVLDPIAQPAHDEGRTGCVAVLLYGIGARCDPDEYAAFLRDEDNPFFNRVAGVARYENHVVRSGDLGWPYLDFLYVERAEDVERVFGDPELQAFQAGWVARWAIDPAAEDPSVNYAGAVFLRSSSQASRSIP